MEIDFTDAQLEKIEILKSKGIDVGQAIDLIFEFQDEALSQIETESQDEEIIEKIRDSTLDSEIKEALMKKEHLESETYDKTLQNTKHKIKWKEFFKF